MCEDGVAVAEREDEWDGILGEQGVGVARGQGTFKTAAQAAVDEVSGYINRDAGRSRDYGEKMWAFVQREKRLAEAEKVERRRDRNRRRAEKWKDGVEVEGQGGSEIEDGHFDGVPRS